MSAVIVDVANNAAKQKVNIRNGFVDCFGKDCIKAKQAIIIHTSSTSHIDRINISCNKSK